MTPNRAGGRNMILTGVAIPSIYGVGLASGWFAPGTSLIVLGMGAVLAVCGVILYRRG